MSSETCVTVTHQTALPDRGGVLKDVSTVLESSTLPESSDPLDFFGAIRDMVERGLTEQERATLHSTEKQDHHVVFPKENSELRNETERLKQRIEDLELELKQSMERSATANGEVVRLRDELVSSRREAEREASGLKSAEERIREQLGTLHVQIGTPTATQLLDTDFVALFDGNSKVELSRKVLAAVSDKKDLDYAVKKLTSTKEKLRALEERDNAIRKERDNAIRDRDQAKKERTILVDHLQQAADNVETAQAQANAALRRERDELLRVKETLAFERNEFRRYRETSEARIKRLRQEAARADELEDQLANKALRLKQKEAEARVLASDGKMVRGLRESILYKDEALSALRQEFEDLRVTAAAAERVGIKSHSSTPLSPRGKGEGVVRLERTGTGGTSTVADDVSDAEADTEVGAEAEENAEAEAVRRVLVVDSHVNEQNAEDACTVDGNAMPVSVSGGAEITSAADDPGAAEGQVGQVELSSTVEVVLQKACKAFDDVGDVGERALGAILEDEECSDAESEGDDQDVEESDGHLDAEDEGDILVKKGNENDEPEPEPEGGGETEGEATAVEDDVDMKDLMVHGTDHGHDSDDAIDPVEEGRIGDCYASPHDEEHEDDGDAGDELGDADESVKGASHLSDDKLIVQDLMIGPAAKHTDKQVLNMDDEVITEFPLPLTPTLEIEHSFSGESEDVGDDDHGQAVQNLMIGPAAKHTDKQVLNMDGDGEGEVITEFPLPLTPTLEIEHSFSAESEDVEDDGHAQAQVGSDGALEDDAVVDNDEDEEYDDEDEEHEDEDEEHEDEDEEHDDGDEEHEDEEEDDEDEEDDDKRQCRHGGEDKKEDEDEEDMKDDRIIGKATSTSHVSLPAAERSAEVLDASEMSDLPDEARPRPRLSLDKGDFAETDEEADLFAAATIAARDRQAELLEDDWPRVSDRRRWSESRVGDTTARLRSKSVASRVTSRPRMSISSCSLSPVPRKSRVLPRRGDGERDSERPKRPTRIRSPSLAGNATSPMARLAPAEHGLESRGNTVVIELGTWRVRTGAIDTGTSASKSFFDDFPCCVARPRIEGADLDEMVSAASSLASPMYSKFRETGVFVGGDAWYCCMDHPDSGLRSKLRLSCPLERGRVRPRDGGPTSDDTERLFDHAFSLLKQDPTSTPTLVTYKPTAQAEEVWDIAAILMEVFRVPAVRLVNEAQLSALAGGLTNGVVVDIGESGTYVTPIFDGSPVRHAMQSQPCGGLDVTHYLDSMLLSRSNEEFNQMVDRRRLEYSRKIKETHCFVALDFKEQAKRCGPFRRKTMRVFQGAQKSPKLSNYDDDGCDPQE